MDIVFVHGWGFHPGVWAPLSRKLSGHHHFIDLGFVRGFKGATKDIPEGSIVIGHSLGVMWALENTVPKALISIAGFDCFHKHVPKAATIKMKRNLGLSPYAQMEAFWQACDIDPPYSENQLNIKRLESGLDWLLKWEPLNALKIPTLALASKNDNIVRADMTKAIWENIICIGVKAAATSYNKHKQHGARKK